jgi:hypothetical protein
MSALSCCFRATGFTTELGAAWTEYRDFGKVLAHEGPLPHGEGRRHKMTIKTPEPEDDGCASAEATLAAAQTQESWTSGIQSQRASQGNRRSGTRVKTRIRPSN